MNKTDLVFCLALIAGLMAVDFVPRVAAGAALGIAGMGNYLGAGVQSILSVLCALSVWRAR